MHRQDLPDIEDWIPFSNAKNSRLNGATGVHMFIDDYRMIRLWHYPQRYVNLLSQAGCVLSPDMSMYTDEPLAMQIQGAYRRQWLGAWWQKQGLTVIPTAGWSSESSYDWCFDGMPTGGCIAVSSVGKQKHFWTKRLFKLGYDAMLERCRPDEILFFGVVPEGLRGNIVHAQTFVEKIRARCTVDS